MSTYSQIDLSINQLSIKFRHKSPIINLGRTKRKLNSSQSLPESTLAFAITIASESRAGASAKTKQQKHTLLNFSCLEG